MGGDYLNRLRISPAAARVNAKLTQGEVAKIMHVSKQTICNWENGKVSLKPAQLAFLAQLYGIDVDDFRLPPI